MTGFTPPGAAGVLPVTQHLIVRYAKRGRMRFASHRDVARAVERGVRRAGVPIAYSAGFTPHPKISYAGAAPTGTASEAEYLQLSLTRRCAASEVRERLDAALPDGIDVIEVTEDPATLAALTLEASEWQVVLPGVSPQEAAVAVDEFLACEAVEVERLTSKGTRRMDARAPVIAIKPETGRCADASHAGNAILRMVVRHVVPAVRPDDILAALRRATGLAPPSPPLVTRLAQGPLTAEDAGAGAISDVCWPSATSTEARGAGPGESFPGLVAHGTAAGGLTMPAGPQDPSTAPLPRGRGVPGGQVETTCPGGGTASEVDTRPGGACNQFPRGADGPLRAPDPGSLTGDSPDARERAARQRVRQ
jgi:radical SAM-linked protein